MNGVFLPHRDVYKGDFSGIARNPSCEFDAAYHFHDFYEIQFYLTDAGSLMLNDTLYSLKTGDIALIRMFEPHHFIPHSGILHKRFAICLDPSFLLAACSESANLLWLFDDASPNYPLFHCPLEKFERYCRLLQNYDDDSFHYGQDIHQRAVLYELLANLFNDLHYSGKTSAPNKETVFVISRLLRYINEHLTDDLTIEDLTRETNFSASYLCRIFKRCTGTTLIQYIRLKRVYLAKQLLSDGLSANNACIQAGFNNYSYFFKTFRQITGISPAEFQKDQNHG
ncbi:MAG: AraC family transcriptional regulator [Elusimicrobiales bacterium]|nr:AraC family transcriptional regulator [Elusimicrobiales bacterium]